MSKLKACSIKIVTNDLMMMIYTQGSSQLMLKCTSLTENVAFQTPITIYDKVMSGNK